MEIKINKEIRGYQESIFFGLSLRQFACSVTAVGAAVGLYFGLRAPLGDETVSWACIVGAAPVAAAGFFHYNGLNFEQFLWAVFKSEWLCAGRRIFTAESIYRLLLEDTCRPRRTKSHKQSNQKGANHRD